MDTGAIEELIGAKINDPVALKKEAKERIKEYFKVSAEKRWALLTPTYQNKVAKNKFVEACKPLAELTERVKIEKIRLRSGVLCSAFVTMIFKNQREHIIKISLVKESGIRQPDPASPFLIDGITVPPFLI